MKSTPPPIPAPVWVKRETVEANGKFRIAMARTLTSCSIIVATPWLSSNCASKWCTTRDNSCDFILTSSQYVRVKGETKQVWPETLYDLSHIFPFFWVAVCYVAKWLFLDAQSLACHSSHSDGLFHCISWWRYHPLYIIHYDDKPVAVRFLSVLSWA